jgi:hypothetical protein
MAPELSAHDWLLTFATGPGSARRHVTIPADLNLCFQAAKLTHQRRLNHVGPIAWAAMIRADNGVKRCVIFQISAQ